MDMLMLGAILAGIVIGSIVIVTSVYLGFGSWRQHDASVLPDPTGTPSSQETVTGASTATDLGS